MQGWKNGPTKFVVWIFGGQSTVPKLCCSLGVGELDMYMYYEQIMVEICQCVLIVRHTTDLFRSGLNCDMYKLTHEMFCFSL